MDWEEVRGARDSKLTQMDVYQLAIPYSQLTDSQKEELATYRQALLDLPSDFETPEEAMENIPTEPSWMS